MRLRLRIGVSGWKCACIAGFALGSAFAAQAQFTDVTLAAGVTYTQQTPVLLPGRCPISNDRRFTCEPARMSGGAAVGDYDGDGLDDLFVTRYRTISILFRNLGDGTFADVTEAAGIFKVDWANAAGWVDIEQDGDLDLFVGTTGGLQNYLFVNDGTGQFTEEAEFRGLDNTTGESHLNFGVAFGDFNSDGWTDIFTCEWGSQLVVGSGYPHHSRLFKNRGGSLPGFFVDKTMAAGVDLRTLNPLSRVTAFSPAFTDLDMDGHPDLAVAADFGSDILLWNDGDGTFTDGTAAAGTNTAENGMGSTFADVDMDGDLDWFITSIWDPEETCEAVGCNWGYSGNRLFINEGNRTFADGTDAAGVRAGWWGWGAGFIDHDNDTDFDLVMTNGVNFPGGGSNLGQFINDPMLFWENDGAGAFTEMATASGITDNQSGKGLLLFDYDNDGDQDIFVTNNGASPVLYRNDASGNAWVRIRFESVGKPYDIWNAKVWVTPVEGGAVQYRETGVSTHFLGQSERTLHFGLGATPPETLFRIEVEWPMTKTRTVLDAVDAVNSVLAIEVPEVECVKEAPRIVHAADYQDENFAFSLSELLRVIQLSRFGFYRQSTPGEDGFAMDSAQSSSTSGYHSADYNPSDWRISLSELLRVIQLYNANGYINALDEEDGFLPWQF
jgi:hypothetical protein